MKNAWQMIDRTQFDILSDSYFALRDDFSHKHKDDIVHDILRLARESGHCFSPEVIQGETWKLFSAIAGKSLTESECNCYNALTGVEGISKIAYRRLGGRLEFWVFSETYSTTVLDRAAEIEVRHYERFKEHVDILYLSEESVDMKKLPTFDFET